MESKEYTSIFRRRLFFLLLFSSISRFF